MSTKEMPPTWEQAWRRVCTETQLARATAARQKLQDLFPRIAEAKDELQRVVDEAQNRPPDGAADGTIDDVKWRQLSSVVKGANNLLIALLFWSDEL